MKNIVFLSNFCLLFSLIFLCSAYGDEDKIAPVKPSLKTTIEQVVMPGQVIAGHVKYERVCESCHQIFRKGTQATLCLDCHKKVAEDVKKEKGFHGISRLVKDTECKKCHPDHLGRDADIVKFNKDLFDHTQTDFPLKENHLALRCVQCHQPDLKLKYRDAPSECIKCHKKDDPHYGRLGEKCIDCHKDATFKQYTYDHSKTKFPLKDTHGKIACVPCHPRQIWQKVAMDCYSCHQLNDNHNLIFGKKCDVCHQPTEWKKNKFDHNKKDAKFLLKGKHAKLKCPQCHTQPVTKEQKPSVVCFDCHKKYDVHNGKLGKYCEKCHTPKGWRTEVFFDHDLTNFPLIGMHASVLCESCHADNVFKNDKKKDCFDCHKEDDKHKQHLGKNCRKCHNPNGWDLWSFEHDKKKFELIGAHKGLDCMLCHEKPVENEIKNDTSCYGCHQMDDAHRGAFGFNCERCHTPVSFRDVKLSR